MGARPATPTVIDSGGVDVTPAGSCLSIVSASPDGWITLSVADGGWLAVDGPVDGATASIGQALPPAVRTAIALPSSPGDSRSIAVPSLGRDGSAWQVRLDLPKPVTGQVCGFSR